MHFYIITDNGNWKIHIKPIQESIKFGERISWDVRKGFQLKTKLRPTACDSLTNNMTYHTLA